jgi:hypothetical protein
MAITKNIVTDYSADNTGVTNAAPKFYSNLKTDMAGQDCTLTIPAGTYRMGSHVNGFFWSTGMTSLVVNGTGASLVQDVPDDGTVAFGCNHMGQVGIDDAAGKSARIQTVSAGATSVTLTAASASAGHISRATVGNWIAVAGWDIQGLFLSAYGWPPNHHFIDFVQITSVVGNTINFAGQPLRYTYNDQWPENNRGSAFEGDNGGPATVYFIHADWGATKSFTGITATNADLVHGEGVDTTFTNMTTTNYPLYPSVNKTWRATNYNASTGAAVEHDKYIDLCTVTGGQYTQWECQSSSTRLLSFDGTTFSNGLNGTPKNTTVDNCTITGNVNIGPTRYGRGETFVCRNTSISGNIQGSIISLYNGASDPQIVDFCTMVNGLITVPQCIGSTLTQVMPPDPTGRSRLFWVNGNKYFGSFGVLSATSDRWPAVDNQSVVTNVTCTSTGNTLTISTNSFTSGDVGKVLVTNLGGSSALKTRIQSVGAFSGTQTITILDVAGVNLTASSKTLQWGTCNTYIQTDQTGGFPSQAAFWPTGRLHVATPPVQSVSFENVTGSALAVDLSQAAARNRPLWSYTKQTYDGTTFGATGPDLTIYGNIVSIKINVTKAYTGVQGTFNVGLSQFDNLSVAVNKTSMSTYGPRVNLKVLGERIITVGSTTGTQSGDSGLNISSPTWISAAMRISTSQNITGESAALWPTFTVEVITDQEIPAITSASSAKVRFRIR